MTGHHPSAVSAQLGLRPGLRVWVGGHSLGAKRAITDLLAETTRPPTGPIDAAFITADTPDEASYFVEKLRDRLAAEATIWIISTEDPSHGRTPPVRLDDTYSAWAAESP